jgi:threonine aldolase
MNFGSDNQTGASAQVMDAVAACNAGRESSYGADTWTARAVAALRKAFDCDLDAYFVPTGTAANSLALACLVQPWNTILCHNESHVMLDELTAPEFFTGGARPVGMSQGAGKLEPKHVDGHLRHAGHEPPHNAIATALSVTQSSENGLVYTSAELEALCASAHRHGLQVHMDGARFANAVASLGCAPADISWRAGVDVLSLGATKNGALGAEAVIFFKNNRPQAAEQFIWRRKRAGHLISKSRFIAAQFVAWLKDDHWLQLARHANHHAALLAKSLTAIADVTVVWPTDANEVFAVLPRSAVAKLRAAGAVFYDWSSGGLPPGTLLRTDQVFVRLVTSFATTEREIAAFCSLAADAN